MNKNSKLSATSFYTNALINQSIEEVKDKQWRCSWDGDASGVKNSIQCVNSNSHVSTPYNKFDFLMLFVLVPTCWAVFRRGFRPNSCLAYLPA